MAVVTEPAAKLEHKGYNRGLILGLTMAESMLLLVFCLLLVAAAIINSERQKAAAALEQLAAVRNEVQEAKTSLETERNDGKRLRDRVAELEATLAALGSSSDQAQALQKEWRELVQARDALRAYENLGVTPQEVEKLEELADALHRHGFSVADVAAAEKRLQQLVALETAQSASRPHEWPPIINLSEAGGYYFQSGSAELTRAFEQKLRGSITAQIAESLARYNVDVIEVIGHTDEQPISRTGSNFDQTVVDVVDGRKPITAIIPADNAGLGIARAIAVANVLRSNSGLKGAAILPMSGAQLVLPGDALTNGHAGNVESRRRIEIRIRRRADAVAP